MSKEIVNTEEKMQALAAKESSIVTSTSNYISLRSGIMTYMDQPMPNNELIAVVLCHTGEHSYYDEPFDPDRIIPPKCFSIFTPDDNDPKPHESVEEPQHENCKGCWAHKFKSASNGRGRACAVRRRLALISASALEEDDLASADIAVMKLPPTSVSNWNKYTARVAAQYQRPSFMVFTRVHVDPHPKFQFMVDFETKALIDIGKFEQLNALYEGSKPLLMTPFDLTKPDDEDELQKASPTKRK
mgnify:CR=1 FL=1|tara:strand:- start:279 stop:1010 length:732 start_codon:yes stop_codon:yes gene_type:complete